MPEVATRSASQLTRHLRWDRPSSALMFLGVCLAVWLGYAQQVNAAVNAATLYTIGPGSAFSQRYGHSVICTHDSALPEGEGTCVDFGVPEATDAKRFTWSMLRGQARFVPTTVPEATVLGAFRAQGRKIESQRLPLDPVELQVLAAQLARAGEAATPYAYHPYTSNCSTQLRDRLDVALSGRLQSRSTARDVSAEGSVQALTLRELAERGNSGRLPELTLFALGLGASNDRVASTWEAMFLPTALRDAVTDLGAPPLLQAPRADVALPTSTHVGRGALLVLGASLAALAHWGRRRLSSVTITRSIGLVLGTLGLLCWSVALACAWDEVRLNWALLLVVPTDLSLAWGATRRNKTYLQARLTSLVALPLLSVVGVIAQPLWVVALLPGLPLGVLYWQLLRYTRQAIAPHPAASTAAS